MKIPRAVALSLRQASMLLSFACFLSLSGVTTAQDILVEHRFVELESYDGIHHGYLEVLVRNQSPSSVANVDLRSGTNGLQLLGNGVLQLGEIPSGEAGIAGTYVVLGAASPTDPPGVLSWAVEFQQEGSARKLDVVSQPLGEEGN